MDTHRITWTAAEPLWPEAAAAERPEQRELIHKPSILRFATDQFMQEFMNILATDPRRLGEFRLLKETWRGVVNVATPPAPKKLFALPLQRLAATRQRLLGIGSATRGKPQPESADTTEVALKLYQPAHERYYLVTACLVCQIAGLPDRKVDAGKQERASFVLRRLLPPQNNSQALVDAWDEYAWIPQGAGGLWRKVDAPETTVIETEERLPLFAVNFVDDDQRSRRLFAGLVPVGKREAYLGAAKSSNGSTPGVTAKTARKVLLRKQVIEPWRNLTGLAKAMQATLASLPDPERRKALKSAREQIQVTSWLLLLDLAEFLKDQMPELWTGLLADARPSNTTLAAAYDVISGSSLGNSLRDAVRHEHSDPNNAARTEIYSSIAVPGTLREALTRYGSGSSGLNAALKKQLEEVDTPYDRKPSANRSAWPDFVYALADPEFPTETPLAADLPDISLTPEEQAEIAGPSDPLDKLAVVLVRALPEMPAAPQPTVPAAARLPANQLKGMFVIRCVYERPACGPLHEDVLSSRTDIFQLAAFFDPDAPARPIRIGLPIDTTPAGLRKFDRNTAFIISDTLCGQLQKIRSLGFGDLVRSVLPWPLHKDLSVGDMSPCRSGTGVSFGMICSLSIPIITLCALILLIIMVFLLDLIFRWVPYFILCFPVPDLKAKS
jgi:hypothetical protein